MEPPLLGASLPLVPVPQAAPRMVTPEVTSSLNATTAGNATPLLPAGVGGGVLEVISPLSLDGTTIPRGRIYAQAWVVDSLGNRLFTVWGGYLETAGSTPAGPASVPGIPLDPSWSIIAVATQSGRGAATRVGFAALISPGVGLRGSPGYVHSEAPGLGRGELVTFSLSNPAAGADFAATTVPAKCLWRVHQMSGTLTASAVASNRLVTSYHGDGGLNVGTGTTPQPITASQAATVDLIRGGTECQGAAYGRVQGGLVDKQIAAGVTVNWVTPNRDAGDQWSSGRMSVEEWAVP